jgi:uncharacterized protein YndB with AHSA1/START domain
MIEQQTVPAVRKSVAVDAPIERAFRVFAQELDTWWPLATHKIGEAPAVGVVVEPRADGRIYERGDDGSESDWGRVVQYEPPHLFAFDWMLGADWGFDANRDNATRVEVRFTAEGPSRTLVELEHGRLERYGAKADEMRETLGADGGWSGLLQAFARAAAAAAG